MEVNICNQCVTNKICDKKDIKLGKVIFESSSAKLIRSLFCDSFVDLGELLVDIIDLNED